MFTAIETIPREELELRWARCRAMLETHAPEAEGLLAFSRVNLYYLTGHLANGLFWLPKSGEPVLLCRKGIERARLESSVPHIVEFRSYKDIKGLLADVGSPLGKIIGVQMDGLPWSFGVKLEQTLNGDCRIVPADFVLTMTRAKKTEWELAKLRLCGERHHKALYEMLPEMIRPGMSEREVSHKSWEAFFALGHSGPLRMGNFGEECFLGHVSAGDSGNYPSVFNGPVGIRGEHPAVPFMGYAGKIWNAGEPLTCDIGFCLEGYVTDKTQCYWAGPATSISDEVRRGHDFCVEIQAWLAERMLPGAIPEDLYNQVMEESTRRGMTEGFMSLGKNKVVFLGHGIGLVIDEFPAIANKIKTPLEEGMVFALEPKFGVPGLGMVGVENTFEVTASGAKCISGHDYDILCIE
ncbi:M24 family metallopeptidase [Desulfovibrio ferrophilus]|uniref:Peptidase M24 n=1 Tax=Desulfovibrio ferrophilus TaxID=241368 RepID=A0A2Z6AYK0_9BACT|nr:Xaa-Pro peptidase family protein [Desulfovibrio ferrophilus]BBD08298.1 peptidase M24 [Desulfovibrio ferrophilus]